MRGAVVAGVVCVVAASMGVNGDRVEGRAASGAAVSELLRVDLGDVVQGATATQLVDGRLVVSAVVDRQPVLVKVRSGGGLDPTFNAAGSTPGVRVRAADDAKFGFGEVDLSVFVQSDGRIVTTGAWGLSRYTSDGLVDSSFQLLGGPIVPDGTVPYFARSAVGTDDGRILLFKGAESQSISADMLLTDGERDTSYSISGPMSWTAPIGDGPAWSSPLVKRGAGWTTALAWYDQDGTRRLGLANFDGDGMLMAGAAGFRAFPAVPGLGFPTVAVDAVGRTIVFGGEDGTSRCVLTRFLPNGQQDLTFAPNSTSHQLFVPGGCSRPLPVAASPSGAVFVAVETDDGILVYELDGGGVVGQLLLPTTASATVLQVWLDDEQPVVMWSDADELVIGQLKLPLPPPLSSVVPARLLESRSGPGNTTVDGVAQGVGRRPAGSTFELQVTGRGGVPADAATVMLNVTAVSPDGPGFVTVFPCGQVRPVASSLNYVAGQVIPNAVLAKVNKDGKVCLFTLAATDLVVDINGHVG